MYEETERITPGEEGIDGYLRDMARYVFAKSYLTKDDQVLDLACGTGYGTYYLGHFVKQITGVDYDEEAIDHAKSHCKLRNNDFLVGDAENLGELKSASMSKIVSFETIEHLHHPESFVKECKRILKPGGTLIMSTPNEKYSSHTYAPHVNEMRFGRLSELLTDNGFNIESVFGQCPATPFDVVKIYLRPVLNFIPLSLRRRFEKTGPPSVSGEQLAEYKKSPRDWLLKHEIPQTGGNKIYPLARTSDVDAYTCMIVISKA